MKHLSILGVVCSLGVCLAVHAGASTPVSLVNPLQGTDSVFSFSHGNNYPGVALPFPMNVWSPYTQPQSDSFYYQYRQNKIRGIRQTHQPSPWIGDYASFALMPVSGKLVVKEDERASEFSHAQEVAQPSYYSVQLDTWKTKAEVTPTERAARFRFTFDQAGDNYVILDAFPGGSSVEIIPGEKKVIGTVKNNRGGVPANFANYFVIIFDQPFSAHGVWTPEGTQAGVAKLEGKHVGAYLKFDVAAGSKVGCKVASSFISAEQALLNLKREVGDSTFEDVRSQAEARWNEALGRARVEGGSQEQQATYYTALYRSILFPHKFYERDNDGKPIYFSPFDGKLHSGFLYTDTGYWDTFRASHPLYNLLYPEVSAEILESIIHVYEESGWLPAWSSPGHRDCMIGNHAFSLLADGYFKGIRSFDLNKAVDAMVHDANNEGPISAIGRSGAPTYNKLGYAASPKVREAAAKTLEYAYNDWCAALLAKAAGRNAEAETFLKKSLNYRNLFDPKTKFMRGRQENGKWVEPFDPTEWGGPFTEGCSWHWTWSVFHNVNDLIHMIGGEAAFAAKLDSVFTAPNTFKVGSYGQPIHEMIEMAALNLGQYAHGNEPIHHMIYLYDYVGQPWKAQSRIRQVMNLLYQPTPDGLCGDEDTGQTSSWYVFSALGFYPVCPGDTNYVIGTPLFDRATLSLAQGRSFVVSAKMNGPQRPYIQGANLNGSAFNRVYLSHGELLKGGELSFEMGSAPNHKWAVSSRPPATFPQSPVYKGKADR